MWWCHSHLKFGVWCWCFFFFIILLIGDRDLLVPNIRRNVSACHLLQSPMDGKCGRNIHNRTTSGWPHPTNRQWCTPVQMAGPLNGAFLPITSHAECWLIYYVVLEGVSSSLGKLIQRISEICLHEHLYSCIILMVMSSTSKANQKSAILS